MDSIRPGPFRKDPGETVLSGGVGRQRTVMARADENPKPKASRSVRKTILSRWRTRILPGGLQWEPDEETMEQRRRPAPGSPWLVRWKSQVW